MITNTSVFNYVPVVGTPNTLAITRHLEGRGWIPGLVSNFIESLKSVSIRFFICDDSGSMMTRDGHRIAGTTVDRYRLVPTTRWEEQVQSLRAHADLAHVAHAPVQFRFLNRSQPVIIGVDDAGENARYEALMEAFEDGPSGSSTLCRHVHEVAQNILAVKDQLREMASRAIIVIFTDGLATDGNLAEALQPLVGLPVKLVVRLCTDEAEVVNYWNELDKHVEIPIDVLDDIQGEAAEVHAKNPWLTYNEPLHRLREFGVTSAEMDLLDERPLSRAEIRMMCTILFGLEVGSEEASLDRGEFRQRIHKLAALRPNTWHPLDGAVKPWVDDSQFSHEWH